MRTNKRVGAVIIQEQKILLIHRFKKGQEYWVLPGGGVEDLETFEQALKREVKEETGLDLMAFNLIGNYLTTDNEHIYYSCTLSPGTPTIGGPEKENSSSDNIYILEWVKLKELYKLNLYPESVRQFLK